MVTGANYKWWVFAAIAIGTFTSLMEYGSTIVALPTIAGHFHTDLPTVQWVVVGNAVAIGALVLPMGRLSDIIGRKEVYIAGFAVFVVGSAVAGSSTSMVALVLAKVLLGCGAAMTQSSGMAMVTSVFPRSERGKALGTQMSVIGAGTIAGPVLGGLLISSLGWRWIFFINVPAGLLALTIALLVLDRRWFPQDTHRPRFDWLGAALSAGAMVAFLLAVTGGPRTGWSSPFVTGPAVACVGLLAAFIWWGLRTDYPILDLRLFRIRHFSLGISAAFLSFLASSSILFLVPFYLQNVLRYSPRQVGLIIAPNVLAQVLVAPISGLLSDRYGWRKFSVAGMVLAAAGLFLLSRLTHDSPLILVMAGLMLQRCGLGIFDSPNASSILGTVEPRRYGVVSALLNVSRNSAMVTSIAVATAIVAATMTSMGYTPSLEAVSAATTTGVVESFASGMRTVFLVMGSLLLLGIVISYLKGARPQETLGQRPVEEMGVKENQAD